MRMTKDDLLTARDAYGKALAHVLEAAAEWGWCYISRPEMAKFDVHTDGSVSITEWRATTYYDSAELDEEVAYLPLSFVLADAKGREKIKADRDAKASEKARLQTIADALAREEQERALLEALKAKYAA